ncbi:MAG TPA: hypothetical protein VN634_17100 [Candidatus Limnocylindrales bacterium]|nr:hypothetical protein [Candidatus Limnocylindrales bacterium]
MTDDPNAGAHDDSDAMPDDESLRRLYHTMPKLEPPVEIDNAILAAARRQATRRRSLRSRTLIRWGVPLAAAASILVTFALTRLEPEPHADHSRAVDTVESRAKSEDQFLADAPQTDSARLSAPAAPAAAPPAAAPPPPAVAALRSRAELRDQSAPAAAGDLAAKESAVSTPPAVQLPWPFGLEPDLAEADACARITAAGTGRCEFHGGDADIVVAPARTIDRGAFQGRSARRIVLHASGGKLTGIDLWLDGAGENPVHLGAP